MEPDMRPRLDGPIEDRIEKYMEDAGYGSKTEFIKYCVNKEIDRREAIKCSVE